MIAVDNYLGTCYNFGKNKSRCLIININIAQEAHMSTFTYDAEHFFIDGKPTKIVSGAIHYFRVMSEYWYDRLLKLKECGCNCVETYVAWNLHEKKEGKLDFSGRLERCRFIDTARELGL